MGFNLISFKFFLNIFFLICKKKFNKYNFFNLEKNTYGKKWEKNGKKIEKIEKFVYILG